ncbi:tRNA dimethylallyltransferase [Agrilactobacillus composti DSM 18527 = JCM 14202]|uniref:tRNA dimethylallyltransferase n=2 Tax=Agrilactobacillus TaxID=2767875 RepID=A0A0R1Y0N2_9LACO|nr:tRNA dimethylallyltransferase [Agrilactobacillus composti DSM 18527 = JCM 14202]
MIVGPTAIGKTDLSIHLAKKFHGEIISGDSMQIYRHLDVGTAKVTPDEMAGVKHYLLDIADVDQRYTVHDFQTQAQQIITQLTQAKVLPIIAGGTGFYLNALRHNLNLGDAANHQLNEQTRAKWTQFYDTVGPQVAWQRLLRQDPVSAKNIPAANKRRIVRALEVVNETSQLFSQQNQTESQLDTLIIGLNTKRQLLYERINARVDQMMAQGLLNEAHWLYKRRQTSVQASNGIGYKELFAYFEGSMSLDAAVALIKRNSRHYAKRQLTYFRNQMPTHWFDPFADPHWLSEIEATVAQWQN